MLTPSEFETYLRIAREQHVTAFKLGETDLTIQFDMPQDLGPPVSKADDVTAGQWKNGNDLDKDPDLTASEWD